MGVSLSGRRRAIAGIAGIAGFTLIELLVTVAILALLAGGAMSFADLSVKRAREQELRLALREIREAIDAYKVASDAGRVAKAADASGYPPTLAVLTEGVADVASAKGRTLYFLRRLPRDPLADASLPAQDTWGLRSHDSEPGNPQPGTDVFDVHSLSTQVGMGGRPYREW